MRISLLFGEKIASLDADPSLQISTLKMLAQADLSLPPSSQRLFFQGKLLDDRTTIAASGIKENDVIQVIPPGAPLPSGSNNNTAASSSSSSSHRNQSSLSREPRLSELPPEILRDPAALHAVIKNTPSLLSELLTSDPPLAEAALADTPDALIAIINERSALTAQRRLAEQQRMAALEADPFNPELQAKIAEEIKRQNIDQNYSQAMEHNPEAFARVVMLYVPIKVNGIPLTAFVDSGAQSTIMSYEVAQRCNIHHLIDTRFSGIAKGVGTAKIMGRVHNVQIQLGNAFFVSSFTILEYSSIDLLFGLDQLKKHQCSIDLKDNALKVYGESIPFLAEKDIPKHLRAEDQGEGGDDKKSSSSSSSSSSSASKPGAAANSGGAASGARSNIPSHSRLLNPSTNTPSASAPRPTSPATNTPSPAPLASSAPSTTARPPSATPPVSAARPTSSSLSSALPANVSEEKIRKLVELGFSRQESIEALVAFGGNEDMAASHLFMK